MGQRSVGLINLAGSIWWWITTGTPQDIIDMIPNSKESQTMNDRISPEGKSARPDLLGPLGSNLPGLSNQ